MARIFPWTREVHTAMLESGRVLTCVQIREIYGQPAGKKDASDRMANALAAGLFNVKEVDGVYHYTAIEYEEGRVWTNEMMDKLAELWPAMGSKCAYLFPVSVGAVQSKANSMGLLRDRTLMVNSKLKHPPRRDRTIANTSPSRDGLPPSTSSIWSYAESVGRELHL